MFFNIIIFFIMLIILTLFLNYTKEYKELFASPAMPTNIYKPLDIILNKSSLDLSSSVSGKINNSMNGMEVYIKPATESFINKAHYDVRLGTSISAPSSNSEYKKLISMCEKQPASCNSFNNTKFAENCGVSFDMNGTDHDNKPFSGGLFISKDQRGSQLEDFETTTESNPYDVFQPTAGTAEPGTFAITKDHCTIIKEKIDCKRDQSFDKNCKQCYTSQDFIRVDPSNNKVPSILKLYGNGTVTITDTTGIIPVKSGTLDPTTPFTYTIPKDAEGNTYKINVTGNVTDNYIAGYLEGTSRNNTFQLDLKLFVILTSKKYAEDQPISINGMSISKLRPNGTLEFTIMIPFTFYDVDTENESMNDISCDGPIITNEASAAFLNSNPCFGSNNKPGNYTLECLQDRWMNLGGTANGTGYPSETNKNTIQENGTTSLTINQINSNLYSKIKQGLLGKDSLGNPLPISKWNELSLWATGKEINTPCDSIDSDKGPLSKECLSYLYFNEGLNSHIGPTYNKSYSSASKIVDISGADIYARPNTYCNPNTSIDPNTRAGLIYGQKLGGINDVKKAYDTIHTLANSPDGTAGRDIAMKQCLDVSMNSIRVKGVFIAISSNAIYYANENLATNDIKWVNTDGSCISISVYDKQIFCTNRVNGIYYKSNYANTGWRNTPGGLRQISTDGVNVVGTNRNNNAYSATVENAIRGAWNQMPSVVKKVVTVNNIAYAIGTDGKTYYISNIFPERYRYSIFHRWETRWASWQKISDFLSKDIAIDTKNNLLVIGNDDKLYIFRNGYQLVKNQPTVFKSISLSNGSIYANDTSGESWYASNCYNPTFIKIKSPIPPNNTNKIQSVSHYVTSI